MYAIVSKDSKHQSKKYWYIVRNDTVEGKLKRTTVKNLGICTKSEAKQELAKLLLTHSDVKGDSIFIKNLFERFDEFYKNQIGLTIKFGTYDLHCQYRRKIIDLIGHLKICDIKISHINNLKETLSSRYKLSNRTINMHLSELKKVLEFAIDNEWINNYPRIKRFSEAKITEVESLTEDQISILTKHANPNQYLFLQLMLLTGMRPFEGTNLKWNNIDFKNDLITILSDNPKKKGRIIPLHPDLKKLLLTIESISEYVSPYRDSAYASRALKRLGKLAKIRVNPYMLRKTCASLMVKRGKHPYLVSRFMGHSSIETTNKHYVHVEVNSLRELLS